MKYLFFIIVVICSSLEAEANWQFNKNDLTITRKVTENFDKYNCKEIAGFANQVKDRSLKKYIIWLAFDKGLQCPASQNLIEFWQIYRTWPGAKDIRMRMEKDLSDSHPQNQAILTWFEHSPPFTSHAKLFWLSRKLAKMPPEKEQKLIKRIWREFNLTKKEEEQFLRQYSTKLDQNDHIYRIERLMQEKNFSLANPILNYLPAESKKLYQARIAIAKDQSNWPVIVNNLPPTLQKDPGLLLEQASYFYVREQHPQVREIILQLGNRVKNPDKWWKMRLYETREAIGEKDYSTAYQLIKNHGLYKGQEFVEAEWLAGWLSLRFLHDPSTAEKHFTKISRVTKSPISVSRAYYWLGRTAKVNKKSEQAKQYFTKAAKYNYTYYGQLAHYELFPNKQINLQSSIALPGKNTVPKSELAKIAYALAEIKQNKLSHLFASEALIRNKNPAEQYLIIRSFQNNLAISSKLARLASSQGVFIPRLAYPILPKIWQHKDAAIIHSIIKQESNFDNSAISRSGAKGFMQLMPQTAKEVATKLSTKYNEKKLTKDQDYNIKLGSTYIRYMINDYKHLVLAISAYNAGPHNVNQWISKTGDPRQQKYLYQVIDWIELIPYNETRNYTQRVLENIQNYHSLKNSKVTINDLLTGGGI